MADLTDSNSTSTFDNTLVEIRASDNTVIGNVDDRLKVDSSFSNSSDQTQLDAFGRLRVSSPETILEATFRTDKQPIIFSESTASGGAATHDADRVSVELSVTTTTNSEVKFRSRRYVKYHPAKSHLITISGNFNGSSSNVYKRIGYFDDNNGVFFELNGSTLYTVRRTKTSGSVVDNQTAQSSWNLDKLDGTGASGITLDTSKQQIFVIDFQWLGSGRIRYGFSIGGKIVYCHEDNSANTLTVPWSQTGDLPVGAEIKNTSATSSNMYVTCFSVICENFHNPEGILRTINNGLTSRSFGAAGASIPVLSLRKQSAYVDIPVKIADFQVFANSSDDFLISFVYNGTLTGASWSNVSGICQSDVSATAISGGTTMYSFYLRGSSSASSVDISEVFRTAFNAFLGRDLTGNSDIFSVVGTNITASASLSATLNYRELT